METFFGDFTGSAPEPQQTMTMGDFRRMTANVDDDRILLIATTSLQPTGNNYLASVVGGLTVIGKLDPSSATEEAYFLLTGPIPFDCD